MKAVVLAAGEGKRMNPLTNTRPKVMLPVANKPILEHLVTEFRQAGITEFLFITGYRSETVRDHFGDGGRLGVKIEYVSQRKQLGTADAVRMAEPFVDGDFLMVNGDVFVRESLIRKLAQRENATMCVVEVADPEGLGVVQTEGDRIVRILEKVKNPPSNLANAGCYLFRRDVFQAIRQTRRSPRGEYEITDTLQLLIDQGKAVSFEKFDHWLDISYPWDLLRANETLMKDLPAENLGVVESHVTLKGAVSVGKGTVIHSGAYVVGPTIIGADCEIGPNCFIRPFTTIGDHCHIGASVEVKNSIVMRNSNVPHLNYVGDSVIGEGCNLGAGTKVANLRLDKKEITAGGVNTGRVKLGAVIGDDVQTGINVSINVGTVVGNGARIGPGALVSGVVSPGSTIM